MPKFTEDLENTEFPFLALKYEKKGENFQKFVKIFQFLSLFLWITNQFLVLLPKRGSLLGNEEIHLVGDLLIFEIEYSNLEQRSIFSK